MHQRADRDEPLIRPGDIVCLRSARPSDDGEAPQMTVGGPEEKDGWVLCIWWNAKQSCFSSAGFPVAALEILPRD